MNDIKRLAGYIGPYKRDMMLGALMVMIETAFELVIPIMIADLIDVGVANHDLAYIYSKGFQMGICALLALVTGLLYAQFAARASYGWSPKASRSPVRRRSESRRSRACGARTWS